MRSAQNAAFPRSPTAKLKLLYNPSQSNPEPSLMASKYNDPPPGYPAEPQRAYNTQQPYPPQGAAGGYYGQYPPQQQPYGQYPPPNGYYGGPPQGGYYQSQPGMQYQQYPPQGGYYGDGRGYGRSTAATGLCAGLCASLCLLDMCLFC